MNNLGKNNNKTFEDIKHIDENGIEFWYARELMSLFVFCGVIGVIFGLYPAKKASELNPIDALRYE